MEFLPFHSNILPTEQQQYETLLCAARATLPSHITWGRSPPDTAVPTPNRAVRPNTVALHSGLFYAKQLVAVCPQPSNHNFRMIESIGIYFLFFCCFFVLGTITLWLNATNLPDYHRLVTRNALVLSENSSIIFLCVEYDVLCYLFNVCICLTKSNEIDFHGWLSILIYNLFVTEVIRRL